MDQMNHNCHALSTLQMIINDRKAKRQCNQRAFLEAFKPNKDDLILQLTLK